MAVRHAGHITPHPHSRSRLVTIAVVLLVALTLAACSSDSGKASGSRRSTTSSSSRATSTSSSSTSTPPATPPTSAPPAPNDAGTCGNQTDAIVAATKATDAQGLNMRAGQFSVQACHLAASSPIWAAAQIVANPGATIPRYTVVLQRIGSLWNVMDVGESGHSGCDAPSEIRADLGLGC